MKILKGIFQGVSISAILFLLSALAFADGEGKQQAIAFIVMGFIFGATSLIYGVEKLSLVFKTLVQCVSGLIALLYVAYVYEWLPFEIGYIITFIMIFLFIFFAIWIVFYFIHKKEVSTVNKAIKNKMR